MTQYVGCEHAYELLDGLVDDELSMADQLAVESHLRWCRSCTMRVEDLRLIGTSLRRGSAAPTPIEDDPELAAVSAGVLMRVRAEREQSLGVRLREMFTDMRLLWPALGATVAVVICIGVAFGVLNSATKERPESLAAMLEKLGNPGSERNPLRPENDAMIPRMLDDGAALEAIPEEEAVFAIRTVVNRDGRVTNYELLLTDHRGVERRETPERAEQVEAVLDAVKQMRFAPAQTRGGQAVAVDMVWVIAKTTAVKGPIVDFDVPVARAPRPKDVPKPAIGVPTGPINQRSSTVRHSTTV